MYQLELSGPGNFKRIPCKTKDEARKAWEKASRETFPVESFGKTHNTHWNLWELFKDGELITEGYFTDYAKTVKEN